MLLLIAFYEGEDRTRKFKVKLNGSSSYYIIQSSGETDGFEAFELDTDKTKTLNLEGVDLRGDEWVSITEVGHIRDWKLAVERSCFISPATH